MADSREASSPFIWPPTIYIGAALVAALVSRYTGWPFAPAGLRIVELVFGAGLIAVGIFVAIAAEQRFKAAGTPVPPTRPTTAIVTTGIYRFTRNPMYLGMSLILAGLGFAFDQLWFLLALPVALVAVTKLAIEREEAYLERKFGAEYVAYKRDVRRWF